MINEIKGLPLNKAQKSFMIYFEVGVTLWKSQSAMDEKDQWD